jgi:glycerophosphoryl diester phosphodiesterase
MSATAREILASSRRLVIAHRGDSRNAPENTLPALFKAAQLKADFVELDYQESRDGVPIVFHDDTLDRLTNARQLWPEVPPGISIASRSVGDLRKLDAGSWFSKEFVETPLSTLAEVCDAVASRALLAIERKTGSVRTLLAVMAENVASQRSVVMAFDWKFLAELHAARPELPLVALGEGPVTSEKLDAAEAVGASAIGWANEALLVDDIRRIHGRNLKAWCWTVDNRDRAAELWTAGLDGLITNVPGEMIALRKERFSA